jgi:SAM-dependent methyltransferase
MNAESMGLQDSSFDVVLCGFMGWNYCFDFARGEFKQADARMKEIWRVLRAGGRVWISAWEAQDDLDWMEETLVRYLPSILSDREFIEHRPIGYSRESAAGYDIILRGAGFKDINTLHEKAEFVSAGEEEWWEQMSNLGWRRYLSKIENGGAERLHRLQQALFKDLERHKRADGIHFVKSVLFATGSK